MLFPYMKVHDYMYGIEWNCVDLDSMYGSQLEPYEIGASKA